MNRKPTSTPPDEASLAAASDWLARLLSTDATDEDRCAAARWAEESPANAQAWAHVQQAWEDLGAAALDPRAAAMRAQARALIEARRKA